MSGNIPQVRKSFTKIKNFTEKDQVRIKYSLLGKEKKPMLSIYIGEDVYNQLTDGTEYKRLNVTYIRSDMVVISPTNDDKGLIHRYNGSGMFKTTCLRFSLGKIKGLKLNKRDFTNKVVEYSIVQTGNEKELKIDISSNANKKPVIANKTYVDGVEAVRSSYIFSKDRGDFPHNYPYIELTDTEADKKHNKDTYIAKQKIEGAQIPYIPFNDLDEIHEKIYEVINNQKALAESMSLAIELLNTALVKEESESPDTNKRIAMLEARFYRLELALEEKNKSLFEKIFGK
jgi:hypothetical protein